MKDRIEINGVWYIKEKTKEKKKIDIIDYLGCVYESDKYCFKAETNLELDENFLSIEVTDKTIKPWRVDTFDNPDWMRDVLNGDSRGLDEINEFEICDDFKQEFREFLQILTTKKWLK
jgi:hypothetical protein